MADIPGRCRVASSAPQSGAEGIGPHTSALALFEAAAERRPAAPAIHYFDATLSYGELDRMAATLSASLTELGLAPGDRVALYLQNVPQFVIAQCAVWKAGGVVVPLNPMLKEAELYDDASGLPHGALRDHELRDVLEIERDPVARREAELGEGRREGCRHPVELPVGERRVEVVDRRRGGPPLGRGLEQRQGPPVP